MQVHGMLSSPPHPPLTSCVASNMCASARNVIIPPPPTPDQLRSIQHVCKMRWNVKMCTKAHGVLWAVGHLHGSCNFVFFWVFWFSRGFFWFLTKSSKTSRKPKKPKKNKIADPNSPACTYMGLAILFFLFFFGFLEVFLVFDQK